MSTFYDTTELKLFLIDSLCIQIVVLCRVICEQLVVCVHYFTAAGEEKGEAGKLELDHNHRGHSNAISFPMQSHNPMAQTYALIRHLGNTSIQFHFISPNQSHISIKWIWWEQEMWLDKTLLQKGPSSLQPFMICLCFFLHVVGNI